jgi:hypothetical protein
LAAGAKHFSSLALADEDVEAAPCHDALEPQDGVVRGTLERTPGEFIKWNQVNLTTNIPNKMCEAQGIVLAIVLVFQQHVFKGQTLARL